MTKEVFSERNEQEKCKKSTVRNWKMVGNKSEAVRAELIEPLNLEIVLHINQKKREYVTGADQSTTLFISTTHYVVIESVGTTYKTIHLFHMSLDTASGYNAGNSIRIQCNPSGRVATRLAPVPYPQRTVPKRRGSKRKPAADPTFGNSKDTFRGSFVP